MEVKQPTLIPYRFGNLLTFSLRCGLAKAKKENKAIKSVCGSIFFCLFN